MTKHDEHHAGSGLDKPDPKTLMEKLGDGMKAVLPKKQEQPAEPAATIIPPAD